MFEPVELKIGKTLKKIMEDNRYTLASLSKAAGVLKSTIAEWLNNRSPHPSQAVKVANHIGVSLHYLLFGKDDSQEPLQRILQEEVFNGTFEITIRRVGAK